MKFWCVILCLFICHLGHALAMAQSPSSSNDLIVRVKSSAESIEGATLLLTSKVAGQRLNITDADGVCEFRGLRAGTYSLQVVQPGFFLSEASKDQIDQLEIRAGESQTLNLDLVKGAVLKGRVVGVEGSPIIGIPISALQLAGKESLSRRTTESNVTVVSDDRGQFRIYGLRPGSYTVAVNAQRNSSPLKSLATIFYPNERESANATVFQLISGQEMSVPEMVLDLTATNQNSLQGTVRELNGKTLRGVSLSLLSLDGSQVTDVNVSDTQGHFSFESLPAGQYLLKARFDSGNYFNLERQISIKDFATNNIVLELKPHPLISGRAYLRKKTGVVPLPSFKLELEAAQNDKDPIELVTDKDGIFSQRSAKAGSFWWSFPELQSEYYVNRILLDGKDITNRPVQLDRTSDLQGIAVEVLPGAAEIRGSMSQSACQKNPVYAVALRPETNEIQFVRQASCLANSFSINSLAPSQYYVIGIPARMKQPDYKVLEHAVQILKKRGAKAVVLDRNQVHQNAEVIMIDSRLLSPGN